MIQALGFLLEDVSEFLARVVLGLYVITIIAAIIAGVSLYAYYG